MFALKVKHLDTYMMITNYHVFSLHNRKYNSPTKSKVCSCYTISEINRTVVYIMFIAYIAILLHYIKIADL